MSRQGPLVRIELSCAACCYERAERGMSVERFVVSCEAPTVLEANGGKPREVGVNAWHTPSWCPLRGQAIAEAVEREGRS